VREPLDIDQVIPSVMDREAAAQRLLGLLPAEHADQVWDELIAPLYDARTWARRWPGGRCRSCSVSHPGMTMSGIVRPHRMSCPRYVGPLQHRYATGHQALMGWKNVCTCGARYDPDESCPDADVDWRGPRPEGSCSPGGEETVPNNLDV
jgi:hypothetical protein